MAESELYIRENRSSRKYTRKEMVARFLWAAARLSFTLSPRPFFGWRRFLLRLFGAKVGNEVHIYSTAIIYMPWNLEIDDWASIGEHALIYNLGKISIGSKTTVSHRAHLCAGTHDYTDKTLPLLKPPIEIKGSAWICADAFIGPGVTIGEGAIVGARAVVMKDVAPWTVVAGNPARFVKRRILVKHEE